MVLRLRTRLDDIADEKHSLSKDHFKGFTLRDKMRMVKDKDCRDIIRGLIGAMFVDMLFGLDAPTNQQLQGAKYLARLIEYEDAREKSFKSPVSLDDRHGNVEKTIITVEAEGA